MKYAELDILGVYVAPVVPMIVLAWLVLIPLRRGADRYGLFRFVWHPALFLAALYIAVLSACVLLLGGVFP